MELNLLRSSKIMFRNPRFQNNPESKKTKVDSISKTNDSSHALTFYPVIDDGSDAHYSSMWIKPFRGNSIDLLFGDTDLAKDFNKGRSGVRVITHLTLTSSNTGRLMIDTKGGTPVIPARYSDDVDIFEGLLKLQETLPPNSIELILNVRGFHDSDDSDSDDEGEDERGLDFNWKGLKLTRNEVGAASLEISDINFAGEKWWTRWSDNWSTFFAIIAINVRLDTAAVAELYKRNFGGGPTSTTEFGSATDMVILVGGNKDKEKAIKCHKAILSEISPVFAAMFQTDMLEAKDGILEIVDFSEAVIRSLVEFAYRWNVEEALKRSEVTLELLKAADKYEMNGLKDILLHIIWSMPFEWFSADVAVKLFFFAKNAGKDLAQAEKKAWKTLKWYAKKYPDMLIESTQSVQYLFENPRAMMELVVLLLNKCN